MYEEEPGHAILSKMVLSGLDVLPYIISTEKIYLAMPKRSKCNTPEIRALMEQTVIKGNEEQWLRNALPAANQRWMEETDFSVD